MKKTDMKLMEAFKGDVLGRFGGWIFFKVDNKGHMLATSLDHIGDHGPIVWDTGQYDVPEYI